jgi:zinc transporter ZupT
VLDTSLRLATGMMIAAVPLKREGFSASRSFWCGQMSGMVEPVAGVIAAGLMMLVIVERADPRSPNVVATATGLPQAPSRVSC